MSTHILLQESMNIKTTIIEIADRYSNCAPIQSQISSLVGPQKEQLCACILVHMQTHNYTQVHTHSAAQSCIVIDEYLLYAATCALLHHVNL